MTGMEYENWENSGQVGGCDFKISILCWYTEDGPGGGEKEWVYLVACKSSTLVAKVTDKTQIISEFEEEVATRATSFFFLNIYVQEK